MLKLLALRLSTSVHLGPVGRVGSVFWNTLDAFPLATLALTPRKLGTATLSDLSLVAGGAAGVESARLPVSGCKGGLNGGIL